MNKAIAEIIAGLIPHKLTRNRWRGILRYGILNSIKLIRTVKRERETPTQYYLAVYAMAKNEGPYFVEWIEWHKNLGVEKFYIYDNESTDDTRKILEPYIESGLVDYVFFPGKKQQLSGYDHCLEKHRFEARWIAFIDLDEFIVPIKDQTIPDFLKRFESFSVVEINGLIYGSGGAKKKDAGGVMERFKYHSIPNNRFNRHVKSIVNPRCVFTFIGAHEAARISGKTADSHGNSIKKNFRDREPQQDIIRLNHYMVKSYEEFLEKHSRGSVRGDHKRFSMEYFDKFDLNDIKEE